jgi:hypothetical protein
MPGAGELAAERPEGHSIFWVEQTTLQHESELPMAITWRLQDSLPGDLFAAFAAAVA